MTCPTCSSGMHLDRSDVNRENSSQYYDRSVYHCVNDDTWVTLETAITDEES